MFIELAVWLLAAYARVYEPTHQTNTFSGRRDQCWVDCGQRRRDGDMEVGVKERNRSLVTELSSGNADIDSTIRFEGCAIHHDIEVI